MKSKIHTYNNNIICKSVMSKLDFLSKLCAIATAFVIPISTTLTQVFFIITPFLVILSGNWKQRFTLIFQNKIAILFLIFFGLFVVGLTYTTAPMHYAFQRLIKFDKFFLGVFFIPIFVDEKWRKYAIHAFLISIGFLVVVSYLRHFDLINYVGHRHDDLSEVYKGHIAFSFLLSFGVYLIMQQFISTKSKSIKILLGIFWLLTAYNILFLGIGRSGYFILASLILLFFVQKLKFKGLLFSVLILAIIAGLAFNYSKIFHDRIDSIFSDIKTYKVDEYTSVGLRMSFDINSIKLIKAHPLIGTGTGSLKNEYANIKPTPAYLTDNPHNEYLNIGVQLGVIGMLFLLFMFITQLVQSKMLPLQMRNIAQATVISIMVGCIANSWLMDVTQGHFYVYFSILAFSYLSTNKINARTNKSENKI